MFYITLKIHLADEDICLRVVEDLEEGCELTAAFIEGDRDPSSEQSSASLAEEAHIKIEPESPSTNSEDNMEHSGVATDTRKRRRSAEGMANKAEDMSVSNQPIHGNVHL